MSLMKQRKFIASGLCVYNCILVTHEKLLDNDENRGETCETLISTSKFAIYFEYELNWKKFMNIFRCK